LSKAASILVVFLGIGLVLVACSNNSSSSPPLNQIKVRAFVSNPLHPTTTGNFPVLEVVDAVKDELTFNPVSLSSLGGGVTNPGQMDVSSNQKLTLVYSDADSRFVVVNNDTGSIAVTTNTLPGPTQSFFLGVDTKHAYAAVPDAPVPGLDPGAVVEIELTKGTVSAFIPIRHARFITQASFGGRIVALGDDGCATIITTANIGTNTDPRGAPMCGFDHPVGGVVAPGEGAVFVLECGPECGGATAGVTRLDVSSGGLGPRTPVAAATAGVISGTTLYVAGTPPGTPCTGPTQATSCGVLSAIDTLTGTVTATAEITDGYHDRVVSATRDRFYIGARDCTNVNVANSETRGCLSIFNAAGNTVKFPPDTGNVTGIAAIPGRDVVYVIENGELRIYDTTTDALLPNHQQNIVGQGVDVKVVSSN
jgi:hypothetical protein